MRSLFLILISLILCLEIRSQSYCILVLTTNNHCYVDETGKVLYSENIDPLINEKIFPVQNGLGRIKRSGKFGFINYKGETMIPIIYDKAEDFNEGLAEVEIKGKWGYINTKGELSIKAEFETIHRFSCGLAAFGKKGKHGYLDHQGNVAIQPVYDRVCHFKNDRAWVLLNGHWGCINKKGEFIIQPEYNDTFDFSEGYAWVKKGLVWGLVDSTNKIVVPYNERNNLTYAFSGTAKNFCSVNNGLMISKANNKLGYCIVPSLKKTIASKFDGGLEFQDDLAIIWVDGKHGLIDSKGNYAAEPIYQEINRIGQKDIFAANLKDKGWGLLNISTGTFTAIKCKNILYLEKL